MTNEAKKCSIFVEIEKPSYEMIFSAIKEFGNLYDGKELLVDLISFIPDGAKDKMIERMFREELFHAWLCKQINEKAIPKEWAISVSDVMVRNICKETIEIYADIEGGSYQELRKIFMKQFENKPNDYMMTLGLPVMDILFRTLSDCGLEDVFITEIVDECNPAICNLLSDLINKALCGKVMLSVSLRNLKVILM